MNDNRKSPRSNPETRGPNWLEMQEMVDFNEEQEQELHRNRWKRKMPLFVAVFRPLQLILSFIVLSLDGHVVQVFNGDFFHTFASSIIAFSWTVMLLLYIIITRLYILKLYNRWLHYAIEFLTLVAWVVTFALFVDECQRWDAIEDAAASVLTGEQMASLNSLSGQNSAIMALRAATWLSGGNSVFLFLTLIACILCQVQT